jgi:hypothetical protein
MGFGCRDEDEDRVWVCWKCKKEFPEDPGGLADHALICPFKPAWTFEQKEAIREFASWMELHDYLIEYGGLGRNSPSETAEEFLSEKRNS